MMSASLLSAILLSLQAPGGDQGAPAQDVPTAPSSEPVAGFAGWLLENPAAETALWGLCVLLLSWMADVLAKRILLRVISRVVARTRFTWDDAIQERRVFHHLAHVAPAAVLYYGAVLVPGLPEPVTQVTQRVALSLMVLVMAISANAFLSAVNDLYSTRPDAKSRPIKGYLQIVAIVLWIGAAILIVSTLLDKRPTIFLGGLAGLTAVVLLVFRDTILSLVASIQLTQNDMIAVGDWIEMPKFGADGDVVDIALHTVKVQNWDKTITTIPTHKLIEDSFKNWRRMSQSGGRRVKRAIHLDLGTIRFLSQEEIERFGRFELLQEYISRKMEEIEAYNAERLARAGEGGRERVIANARRLTNLGTFRSYIVSYLRQHPKVHQGMTLLVRQLQSGPTGLPLEIYVFSNDTSWVEYEGFQSDIFDHLLAMVPEFGLRVFQNPSGQDLRGLATLQGKEG
jgi:miniconductance mechanosensitive channel